MSIPRLPVLDVGRGRARDERKRRVAGVEAGEVGDLVGEERARTCGAVPDELELHVIPVLFGQGRRLFEGLAPQQIELQRTQSLEGEDGVTHMHYRVQR